jgi:hypothetical protein
MRTLSSNLLLLSEHRSVYKLAALMAMPHLLQGFEKDDAANTEYQLPQSQNAAALPDLISSGNFGEPGTW